MGTGPDAEPGPFDRLVTCVDGCATIAAMLRRDFISLGTMLQIEITGLEDRFRSTLVGMEPDRYLMIKTPIALSVGMIRSYLLAGTTVTVRYLFHGSVWGFQCNIIQSLTGRIPVVFLSYPDSVENHDLRSAERIDCLTPGDVVTPDRVLAGMVTDLSQSGARLVLSSEKVPGLSRWTPDVGDTIALALHIPGLGSPVSVSARLRNLSRDEETVYLGVQFLDLEPQAQEQLLRFLGDMRARFGN